MENKTKSLHTNLYFIFWLFIILILASWVRTYNINWDQGTHLHPDERYLTMVVSALRFPDSLQQYWDTSTSPLNPTNHESFAGYVYGTLPLFVTRAVGGWVDTACGAAPTQLGRLLRAVLLNASGACNPGTYVGYSGIHLVGRALSTVADLITLLGLALLGRTLYNRWIGLFAAFLYAFAALPIQHAHFFVVDSFATVFVVGTLYFAAKAVQSRAPWWLLPAGIMTGLAVASKISVWPVVAVVVLAAFLRCTEDDEGNFVYGFAFVGPTFAFAVISGLLAAVTFRIAQPYAFSGPGFWNVQLNQQWLATIEGIRDLVNGQRDVPYGHQWANRTPIIFPGRNLIFWGIGLPLGLTAGIGWSLMAWKIFRKRKWHHLLVWAWGTGFFLYQGTQWVKSMRYLLPIYPVVALLAAWVSYKAVDYGRRISTTARETETKNTYRLRSILKLALFSLPIFVALGTVLWGMAFLQIYMRPFTRITASEWMYANIPTTLTLHSEQNLDAHVPLQPDSIISEGVPANARFTIEQARTLDQITLNKVNGMGQDGPRDISVRISSDPAGEQTITVGQTTAYVPWQGTTAVTIPLGNAVALENDVTIYVWIAVQQGAPVKLQTSVIANEHWDDALPVRLAGKDPFWNWYRGLSSSHSTQMNHYDNDTLEKRQQLFDWLDETDYIALSSNRLYASIARLPLRYPLTVAYYDALFDGRLGFELAAEFVSYPTLGPCQFPDQEIPFDLMPPRYSTQQSCSIPYPPAEEAYSVYDHPTVLIFAKTAAYSRQKSAALLPESLLDDVQWMTPLEATRNKSQAQPTLMMDAHTQVQQATAGTWSQLFDRQALRNRYPVLAAILWWLLLFLLGVLVFPWLYSALPNLRYRGYGLARIVGLLTWSYIVWLLASTRVVPYTRWSLWGVFVTLGTISSYFVYRRWREFKTFALKNWRAVLRIEIIFVVLYAGWLVIRYFNPDLWHPIMGGEKPMDFAYFNAVIKSIWFPPYDPWFAGGIMNYYYFGFVMVASLTKALGIMPSITYNLIIPAFFAMTGVGAYTLASNLAGRDDNAARSHRAGLWGVLFVVLLGNLGELQMVFKGLTEMGNIQFESLIPGYPAIVSAVVGLWQVIVKGQLLPFRPEWWYWNATRVVSTDQVINEFPAFTFLYGDLHAHMLALPLTQIALAVALQWGLTKFTETSTSLWQYVRDWKKIGWGTFVLGALAAGALRATNTWDYPTYLGLMSVSFWIALFLQPTDVRQPKRFPYYKLLMPLFLFIGAELLFRPFVQNYAVAYTTFERWRGTQTSLGPFLVMHGQFLFPLCLVLIIQIRPYWFDSEQMPARVKHTLIRVIVLAIFCASLGVYLVGVQIAWLVIPMGVLAAIMVLAPSSTPRARLLWFWVGTALALCIAVEVIVLKGDIGRMNTVFKFYLQVWMLLALSAAVATETIFHRVSLAISPDISTPQKLWRMTQDILFGVLGLILAAMAMYPLLAIPARAKDRWRPEAPHTLDGMAFMPYALQYEHGGEVPLDVEYRVIRWFQDNVEGTPIIIEGQAEREYLWGNRVSVYTGLPTVVAWRWHQVQQRMVMPGFTVETRQQDVRDFYNTISPEFARDILEKYDVDYIVLTPYERAYMLVESTWKFTEMVERGWLSVAYEEPEAVVYKVIRTTANLEKNELVRY